MVQQTVLQVFSCPSTVAVSLRKLQHMCEVHGLSASPTFTELKEVSWLYKGAVLVSFLGCKSHFSRAVTKAVGDINSVQWHSDLNADNAKIWVLYLNATAF
ncbi:hypothetical protein TNCT_183071 [Trichonephila clavata]|uniref:Uncharacterized protein n=1 Tax=Trichonephila clavata TaxID=2740835 RepID=A0A8X6K054_TRICU|nr:hypothetical protein TNCT_183071 [Trichonephila clavata]